MVSENLLKWWPVAVASVSIIAAGAIGQFQLGVLAEENRGQDTEIKENADDIEVIQRRLIERAGNVELGLERLRIEQRQQEEKLDEIIDLLRDKE